MIFQRTLALALAFTLAQLVLAQNIGINVNGATPAASALLDIDASALPAAGKRGLLIPRIALTSRAAAAPVVAPATSLVIYNTATAGTAPDNVTPGFYYWDGTAHWLRMFSGNEAWGTLGNYGTVAGTNYIGTNDATDFVVKTGGTAAANERLRIMSTGAAVMNKAGAIADDVFSVYATGTTGAISSLGNYAVNGYSSTGVGVYGASTSTATTGDLTGVIGEAVSSFGTGVLGQVTGDLGYGVVGSAASTTLSMQPIGVFGLANNATGFGLRARNLNVTGTGAILTGNAVTGTFLVNGSGASLTGTGVGGLGFAQTAASGCGLVGVGNNSSSIYTPTTGAGVVGTGKQYGVIGFATSVVNTNPLNNNATNGINGSSGGYFEVQNTIGAAQTWAYVGVRETSGAGGLRKIIGPGTVNTIVTDLNGTRVALSCPEAPENLFQDYGSGYLVNGRASVEIDPILAKNIIVDASHPLRVFVQPEGDCKGVYVTNKTRNGFEVVELSGGASNTPFTYSITANRADEALPDGTVSRYSEERFPPAPGPVATIRQEIGQVRDARALPKHAKSTGR